MRSDKYTLQLGAPAAQAQNVEDLRDMTVQVAAGGTGTANLEGTIDGNTWITLVALTGAAQLSDVPINNVSAVRVNGALAGAEVTLRGFNVRGDS